jgi:TonB family protein
LFNHFITKALHSSMRFLSIVLCLLAYFPVFAQNQDSIPLSQAEIEEALEQELIALKADVLPEFPGGAQNMGNWLTYNLNVPYFNLREDTLVRVYVDFTVEHTGYVTGVKLRRPSGFKQLDREILLLFSRMPKWKPGALNGKPVDLNLTIPMNVQLGNSMRKPYNVPTPEVSRLPQYVGGGKALAYFIRKNLQYPKEAKSAGISGAVTVEFLILANGRVDNAVTIGDAIGYGLEEEATRIVEKMPKWIPAELDGRKVPSKHQVIIRFELPK